MHAVPTKKPGSLVDPTGKYRCPVCRVQSTGDEFDTGWVSCPLLGGAQLCLGCCIDQQGIARAEDISKHPFLGDFRKFAGIAGQNLVVARMKCMAHQVEVLREQIAEKPSNVGEVRALLQQVHRVATAVSGTGDGGSSYD